MAGDASRELVAPPRSTSPRFDELEGYRGLVALSVIVFHTYQASRLTAVYVYEGTPIHWVIRYLECGVSMFFVLSGFVIFLPFARALVDRSTLASPRWFLIRRTIRVVPAYLVAILVVWTLRYDGSWSNWLDLIEHLTFTQVFDRKHIFFTIGPAWSLADEVEYYVVLALVVWFLSRGLAAIPWRAARFWLLVLMTIVFFTASLGYIVWAGVVAAVPLSHYEVWFNPLARLNNWVLGMMLALLLVGLGSRSRLSTPAAALVWMMGLGVIVGAGFYGAHLLEGGHNHQSWFDNYYQSVCGVGFVLILGGTVLGPESSPIRQALRAGWLRFLGLISYSIYLWHEPIMIQLQQLRWVDFHSSAAWPRSTLITMAVAIALGAASYWIIEKPVLEARHLFTKHGRLAERYAESGVM